jgi:hypothetical protein
MVAPVLGLTRLARRIALWPSESINATKQSVYEFS